MQKQENISIYIITDQLEQIAEILDRIRIEISLIRQSGASRHPQRTEDRPRSAPDPDATPDTAPDPRQREPVPHSPSAADSATKDLPTIILTDADLKYLMHSATNNPETDSRGSGKTEKEEKERSVK